MKIFYLILLAISFSITVFGQSKIDTALQNKLHQMFKDDQKWRRESAKLRKHEHSDYNEETIDRNWQVTDSTNLEEAKRIIKQYGYPGYSLVGESGSGWFWAIVQHCDDEPEFQQKVLTLMEKEVKRHNASGENFAYLTDRVLVNQGHKQLYGTQTRLNEQTKHYIPFPTQDSLHIDDRRKAVGLSPINDYLKGLEKQ
jgi:hypothetical protein